MNPDYEVIHLISPGYIAIYTFMCVLSQIIYTRRFNPLHNDDYVMLFKILISSPCGFLHIPIHTHTNKHTHMHKCRNKQMYTLVHTHTHIYIYTHTLKHKNTHTNVHTHTSRIRSGVVLSGSVCSWSNRPSDQSLTIDP